MSAERDEDAGSAQSAFVEERDEPGPPDAPDTRERLGINQPMRRGTVRTPEGDRIYVEDLGFAHAGTPLLLLRPLAGSVALWGPFRDALARTLRVLAFDPLGVGRSGSAHADVSTRSMAIEALCVLDALGVARAHVFGISLGAMVATWLAIDAPERVARLCLASAGPVGLALTAAGLVRGASAAASSVLAPDDEVVSLLAGRMLSDEVKEQHPERLAQVEAAAGHDPARRVALALHAVAAARHDPREALAGITAPTLVLTGDRDELLGSAPAEALARVIAGAELARVYDAGHDLTLERPDETARLVAAFLAR